MLRTPLVDDDAGSMRILEQAPALFSDVETVGRVTSGMEALLFVRDNPTDLVFLDIEMDEMNGFEVAEHLHSHHPGIQKNNFAACPAKAVVHFPTRVVQWLCGAN